MNMKNEKLPPNPDKQQINYIENTRQRTKIFSALESDRM